MEKNPMPILNWLFNDDPKKKKMGFNSVLGIASQAVDYVLKTLMSSLPFSSIGRGKQRSFARFFVLFLFVLFWRGGDVFLFLFLLGQIFCSLLGSNFKSQSSLLDPYSFLSERERVLLSSLRSITT